MLYALSVAGLLAVAAPREVIASDAPGSAVTIEIDELLTKWAEAMLIRPDVEIRFRRYSYDSVFQIEKRSEGRIYFEDLRHGLMTTNSIAGLEDVSMRTGADGVSYRLQPGERTTWFWDDDTMHILHPDRQLRDSIEIHPSEERIQSETGSFLEGFVLALHFFGRYPEEWLHGIVGVDAYQFNERFELEVQHHETRHHLIAIPRKAADQREFRRLEVLIDKETFRTYAVRIFSPSMQKETVYVLQYANVDPEREWRPDVSQLQTTLDALDR